MDLFHAFLLILFIATLVVIGRPFVAIFNMALRGWIKSSRKTIEIIRR